MTRDEDDVAALAAGIDNVSDATVNQLVTHTKHGGCMLELRGHTTPEGWPFMVLVLVGTPRNARVIDMGREFSEQLGKQVTGVDHLHHPDRSWP